MKGSWGFISRCGSSSWSLFVPFILIFLNIDLQAQDDERTYRGGYRLSDSLRGRVRFQYDLQDGDTIKDGDILFHTSAYDRFGEKVFEGTRVDGHFDDDRKMGTWHYRSFRYRLSSKPELQGRRAVFRTKGNEEAIRASFRDGKADGRWRAMHRKIEESEPVDTSFLAEAKFRENVPVGTMSGVSGNIEVKARFAERGLLDGTLLIVHRPDASEPIREHRVFDRGVPVEHFFTQRKDTVELSHSLTDTSGTDGREGWDTLRAGMYNSVLELSMLVSHRRDSNGIGSMDLQRAGKSNDFIKKTLRSLYGPRKGKFWDLFGKKAPMLFPRVSLRRYPFEQEEKELLKKLRNELKTTRDSLKAFFNDTRVDINQHAYKKVKQHFEIMRIYEERIDELGTGIARLNAPALEYFDREEVMEELIPKVEYPDSLHFEFKERSYDTTHAFPSDFPDKDSSLKALLGHIRTLHRDIIDVSERATEDLEQKRKQEKVSGREKILVQEKDSLYGLFDPERGKASFNRFHRDLAPDLRKFYNRKLEEYANLNLKVKIEEVDPLIDCFRKGIRGYFVLAGIPDRLEELDDAYTRTVWNPYTYTHMDERLHPDLYESFREDILPYLLKDLENGLSCSALRKKLANFGKLFRRMMELKDQKNDQLERKLRKAGAPEEKIEILELNFHLNR